MKSPKTIQEVEEVVQALEKQVEELVTLTSASLSQAHSRAHTASPVLTSATLVNNDAIAGANGKPSVFEKIKIESIIQVNKLQEEEIKSLKQRLAELEKQQTAETQIYGAAMQHLEKQAKDLKQENLKLNFQIKHLVRSLELKDS